jgi:prepilin-type N-terminal cleavage/methylation domain-containing protein
MGARRLLVLAPAGSVRRGMTLIETLIAVVILGTALVALGNFMAHFAHATKVSSLQQRALDFASDRIDSVKHSSDYTTIDTMATTESITADSSTYTRQTIVQHIGGGVTDTLDYRVVTVSVTMPTVTIPMRKTTIIAAF